MCAIKSIAAVFTTVILGLSGPVFAQSKPIVLVEIRLQEQEPEKIELMVTAPVEKALMALPNVKDIRSTITYGYSRTEVEFETTPTEAEASLVRDCVFSISKNQGDGWRSWSVSLAASQIP